MPMRRWEDHHDDRRRPAPHPAGGRRPDRQVRRHPAPPDQGRPAARRPPGPDRPDLHLVRPRDRAAGRRAAHRRAAGRRRVRGGARPPPRRGGARGRPRRAGHPARREGDAAPGEPAAARPAPARPETRQHHRRELRQGRGRLMGRPRKGVVPLPDGRCTAGLPIAVGSKKTRQFTDADEAAVRRWYADGERALAAGWLLPDPAGYRPGRPAPELAALAIDERTPTSWWAGPTAAHGHRIDKVAAAFVEQYYDRQRSGQPERRHAVVATIANDLLPFFAESSREAGAVGSTGRVRPPSAALLLVQPERQPRLVARPIWG